MCFCYIVSTVSVPHFKNSDNMYWSVCVWCMHVCLFRNFELLKSIKVNQNAQENDVKGESLCKHRTWFVSSINNAGCVRCDGGIRFFGKISSFLLASSRCSVSWGRSAKTGERKNRGEALCLAALLPYFSFAKCFSRCWTPGKGYLFSRLHDDTRLSFTVVVDAINYF